MEMMGNMMTQAKRTMPMMGDDEPASANAYYGMTAMVGAKVWGLTALLYHFVSKEVALLGAAGVITFVWMMVVGIRFMLGRMSYRSSVQFSSPGIVWLSSVGMAFMLNIAGLFIGNTPLGKALMWLPWFGAFAVAYTATGLLVERGGVYVAAGAISGVFAIAGTVLGLGTGEPAFPLPFVILGLLHAVPMAIDAMRGGRQIVPEEGVPAVQLENREDGEDGGVQELGA